ncbi:hypothetical protein GJ496_007097 [Pomphorhynchus laevis]|nr:hypothetical protein GJ496_007097 [Pomphorhynchus laevis]
MRQIDQLMFGPLYTSNSAKFDDDEYSNLPEDPSRSDIWSALRNFDYGNNLVRMLCCNRGLIVETPYQTAEDRRHQQLLSLSTRELFGWDIRMTMEKILLRICACPERLSKEDEAKWNTKKLITLNSNCSTDDSNINRNKNDSTKLVRCPDRIYSLDLRDDLDRLATKQISSIDFVNALLTKCQELGRSKESKFCSNDLNTRGGQKADKMLRNEISVALLEGDHYCHRCKKYFSSMNNLKIHMQTFHQNVIIRPSKSSSDKTSKTKVCTDFTSESDIVLSNIYTLPKQFTWHPIKVTSLIDEISNTPSEHVKPWCFVNNEVNTRSLHTLCSLLCSWIQYEPGICVHTLQQALQRTSQLAVLTTHEILELACAIKCCNYLRAVRCLNAINHEDKHCDELGIFEDRPNCQLADVSSDDCRKLIQNTKYSAKSIFWYINEPANFNELFKNCVFDDQT